MSRKNVEFMAEVRSEPFGEDKTRVAGRGFLVAPGLVVGRAFTYNPANPQSGDAWRFHHTASGRGFGYFRSRAGAYRAVARIAPLADWTKSATAIKRLKIGKRVHEIIREEGGTV